MEIEIRPPGWYPFHNDPDEILRFTLGSVAIWAIVNNTYFLVVQQADRPGLPWGIPAGHVEPDDNNPRAVAIREFTEETGLPLTDEDLKYLNFIYRGPGKKGHLLFVAQILLNNQHFPHGTVDEDGTIQFEPPASVNRGEICMHALIPLTLAFQRSLLNNSQFHVDYLYRGYIALREMGVVQGRFDVENDPYL